MKIKELFRFMESSMSNYPVAYARDKLNIKKIAEATIYDVPSEDAIFSGWKESYANPVVSILCHTFNHKGYIEDALKSFLIQETQFPFEVVVHDDASTDGTTDIIRAYQNRYPRIIKPIIQVSNQYSKGFKPSLLSAAHAKGKFLAICEGDDYWVDMKKLERQVTILELNESCKMMVSPAIRLLGDKAVDVYWFHGKSERFLEMSDLLSIKGTLGPTASYMVRADVFREMPDWFKNAPVGDLFIELISLIKGGVIYDPTVTCVYRMFSVGSWTANLSSQSLNIAIKQYESYVVAFESFNKTFRTSIDFSYRIADRADAVAVKAAKQNDRLVFKRFSELSYKHNAKGRLAQRLRYNLRERMELYQIISKIFGL